MDYTEDLEYRKIVDLSMNVTQYCMQLDSIEVCIWGSHTVSVVHLTKKEPLPLVGEEGLGVFSSPLRMRMGQASSPETPPLCTGKGITVSHGSPSMVTSSASITCTTDYARDQSVYEF